MNKNTKKEILPENDSFAQERLSLVDIEDWLYDKKRENIEEFLKNKTKRSKNIKKKIKKNIPNDLNNDSKPNENKNLKTNNFKKKTFKKITPAKKEGTKTAEKNK